MKETPRFFAGTALIVCGLTLAGCATDDTTRSSEEPDIVQRMSFWQPYLLYVLYYSGALSDEHAVAEANCPGEGTALRPRQRDVHCHADLLPYPALILMNTSYMRNWHRDQVLPHEAGHLTGLAGRPTHASGYHCLSPTCLMNRYFHFHRFLLGWQQRPCKRCVAQLAESSRQPPPANLRFVGPVLVRSENGYHILSLPERVRIVVGDLAEQDCRDFAAAVRAETPSPGGDNDEFLVDGQVNPTSRIRG